MAALSPMSAVLGNFVLSPSNMLWIGLVALIVYYIFSFLHTVYFHPLSSFPGPWLMRGSFIPYSLSLMSGRQPYDVLDLHRQYGPVVRISPEDLVFLDVRAWKDLMGHRGSGEAEFGKSTRLFRADKKPPVTVINAPREEHGRLRRQLAYGFSDRSLREQQPIIKKYIDLLLKRLHEHSEAGSKSLDMVKWYNYTTFDVIGDLALGEAFGCLETSHYHPWIAMIFQYVKLATWYQTASLYPWVQAVLVAYIPKSMKEKRDEHRKIIKEKMSKRMELGAARPDFMEGLLCKQHELGLTISELEGNAEILVVAGSETTATLLSGITYLLGSHPDALAKLTEEVRTAFKSEDDIDFVSVSNLAYMLACLDEAMRLYPPVPIGPPRESPKGGGHVAGYYVPENTAVSIFQYAAYHSEKFWALPDEFHPERWLGDTRFANDEREILQPFHLGPRNCIGRNLAYIEMRLILARVLWNFDIQLADDSENWMKDQKIYMLWEKPPLNVFLTPRLKD